MDTMMVRIRITAHQTADLLRNRIIQRIAMVCLVVVGCAPVLLAQFERANTGTLTAGATANYRFAESSELAITVTLLGPVTRPGRYEVSPKVDLVELIALAGGWGDFADMSNVQVTREKVPNDPTNRFTLRLNLENVGDVSPRYLELQDGDVILIGKSTPVTAPLILSIITTAATAAMAIAYFTVVNR